ncbi:sensory box histidine kinase/response regulator [hydrothermal vent metagenome]|uniref:histidine kinase n=1 Tax=hydrothermal vent metagenome TaxID=652676 RepID=A0A1W1BYK3_9ZZZZ
MRQLIHRYTTKDNLLEFLDKNGIERKSEKILIQLFSSKDKERTKDCAKEVCHLLPNATLIGSSSAGEIVNRVYVQKEIVLSISIFKESRVEGAYVDNDDSYLLGKKVAYTLIKEDTKALISFIDAFGHKGEQYIAGLRENSGERVAIAGGVGADLLEFKESFILFQDKLYTKGAVAVALSGDDLDVYNDYNLGRKAIGPTFTITKVEDNRIYEINNIPTIAFYKEVLGEEVVKDLPSSAIEFALLKEQNGLSFARMMLKSFDDGSALYTGSFNVGDRVRFSFSSLAYIDKHKLIEQKEPKNWDFQALFCYACASKREFLFLELERAFTQIDKVPLVGFFTYGEFYGRKKETFLLNMATSLLFIAERVQKESHQKKIKAPKEQKKRASGSAILHLIDYVSANFEVKQQEFESVKFKLDEILNAINSVVIISRTDPKGIITYANERFEEISGYTKEELLGKPHNIVRDPKVDKSLFKQMWATIKKGKVWQGILSNRAKDGSIYYVNTHIFPIFDVDCKTIVEYMAVREDITELELAKQKAQKAEAAQAMFLANMSHEIRTPMNGILGFIELLEKSKLTQEQKKYVDIIRSSTKSLLHIINDILDSSKIANEKLELESIPVDLKKELFETYALLESLAKQKDLHYKIELDQNIAKCLKSDPTRLRQVITNLLSNAIKFTPKNGEVLLRSEVTKEDKKVQTIRFLVKDSGIGIPKEKIKTIFKPFVQADSSTTREFGGTGLGLNISANLVKAFGGKLEVESVPKRGSTFFFEITLPKCDIKMLPNKSITKEKEQDCSLSTQELKMLIAEDYEINRKLLSSILEKYPNISYTFAHDGEEAIKKAKENSYDIILMDINMPKCSGIEATKEIRKSDKTTPIIALTAHALNDEREQILSAGMNDHIIKPIEIEELRRVITSYAQKREIDISKLLKELQDNLGVDITTIKPLFRAYISSLKESMEPLKEAILANDSEQIVALTHKLRGGSASFGLGSITQVLKEIEDLAKEGKEISYERYFTILKECIEILQKELS